MPWTVVQRCKLPDNRQSGLLAKHAPMGKYQRNQGLAPHSNVAKCSRLQRDPVAVDLDLLQ